MIRMAVHGQDAMLDAWYICGKYDATETVWIGELKRMER
jgi:hypothetical protein